MPEKTEDEKVEILKEILRKEHTGEPLTDEEERLKYDEFQEIFQRRAGSGDYHPLPSL